MKRMPLNFAVLKYMTTVDHAVCPADVMKALEKDYHEWRMFTPAGILEVLMTGEKNGLLYEDHYELDENGEVVLYFGADKDGIDAINSYIK